MVIGILLQLAILVPILLCLPNKAYGPFDVHLNSYAVCHAPKPTDCTTFETRITGPTSAFLNLTVLKACSPSKGKIVVSAGGKELTRLQMNKPCQHVFLRPIFEALYKADKNCQIMKGEYVQEVDIGQYFINYFGGNFFYGNVSFRTYLYNDECNFACSTIEVTLTPKK